MLAYVLRRLLATVPVMLIVAVLVFLMLRLTPSDPAAIIAGDTATTEQVVEILLAHPALMERPVVVKGDQVVLGRPPENVQALLD